MIGWFVVGPMAFVCLRHAATAEDARRLFEGRYVAAVEPVKGTTTLECVSCSSR